MKWCSVCKKNKSLDSFNKNRARKDGLQTRCRSCDQTRAKARYAANPLSQREAVKRQRARWLPVMDQIVVDWLRTHPCVDCGEADIVVLEFDHVRGKKTRNVSLFRYRYTPKLLQEEIAKCEVRCANCHRRKTARERNFWILNHV